MLNFPKLERAFKLKIYLNYLNFNDLIRMVFKKAKLIFFFIRIY